MTHLQRTNSELRINSEILEIINRIERRNKPLVKLIPITIMKKKKSCFCFCRSSSIDETVSCPVCLENKNIIILNCNHKICNECWYIITEKGNDDYNYKSVCPLCRNLNQW